MSVLYCSCIITICFKVVDNLLRLKNAVLTALLIFFRGFLSAANWYLRCTSLNHVNDNSLKLLPHSTSQLEGRLIVKLPLLERNTISRTNLVTRLAVMSITIATIFQGQLPSSGFSYYNRINSFQMGWIGQHGDMQGPCVTIVKIHGTGCIETKKCTLFDC